jgi:isohexenylglutaconyl-CoA hydratase
MSERHITSEFVDGVLTITFARPKRGNALSLLMVQQISEELSKAENDDEIRVLVFRGSGKHFCAGGDIKDMASARQKKSEGVDPIAQLNRSFGTLITRVQHFPKPVVMVIRGAAMGGGFGLVCVLPETGLGLPPAQIAPFLVTRLGLSKARKLALTGASLRGEEAKSIGLIDECVPEDELEELVDSTLTSILRCAPIASAITKQILLGVGHTNHEELLDQASKSFAECARGKEGTEGMMAFLQKRKPSWARETS